MCVCAGGRETYCVCGVGRSGAFECCWYAASPSSLICIVADSYQQHAGEAALRPAPRPTTTESGGAAAEEQRQRNNNNEAEDLHRLVLVLPRLSRHAAHLCLGSICRPRSAAVHGGFSVGSAAIAASVSAACCSPLSRPALLPPVLALAHSRTLRASLVPSSATTTREELLVAVTAQLLLLLHTCY